jgi:CRISPR/Cas system-associated exonuclease Cas4 (RecB family)
VTTGSKIWYNKDVNAEALGSTEGFCFVLFTILLLPGYIVGSMRLTFSKLDTYSKCPLRFRLRYQEKLPEAPRRGRNLSIILHKTLESFLFHARRDSSLATLLRAYETRCAPPQTPEQERRYQEGRRALEAFHWREGQRLVSAVALEQSFSVRVGGLEIIGRLDCALETEAGLELIDFKFTNHVPQDPDPLQLQLYALGLQDVTGATPDTLTYYYLRQEQRIFFPGGEAAIQVGKEQATRIAQQLHGDDSFSPQVGSWCHTCSYQRYCSAQREKPDPVPQLLVQARLPL